jgi:hypothetical protein
MPLSKKQSPRFSPKTAQPEVWEDVLDKLRSGQMPPKGMKQPSPGDVQAVEHWIETELARIDNNVKPDPGRVTAHRLNRFE